MPSCLDREALERQAADGLALHEVGGSLVVPVARFADVDRRRDADRIDDFVEAAVAPASSATMMVPHGVRRTGSQEERPVTIVVALRWPVREVDALHGGVRRLLVAHEHVRRMVVVRPERDLIRRGGDGARDQRDLQPIGHLDRLQVVGAVVRTERALGRADAEAEQLFGVCAQLMLDERAEIDFRLLASAPVTSSP